MTRGTAACVVVMQYHDDSSSEVSSSSSRSDVRLGLHDKAVSSRRYDITVTAAVAVRLQWWKVSVVDITLLMLLYIRSTFAVILSHCYGRCITDIFRLRLSHLPVTRTQKFQRRPSCRTLGDEVRRLGEGVLSPSPVCGVWESAVGSPSEVWTDFSAFVPSNDFSDAEMFVSSPRNSNSKSQFLRF